MNRFDTLFFSQFIPPNESIHKVFHRHFFVILEDIVLWLFFAVLIPSFLYNQDIFSIQSYITHFSFGIYLILIYGVLMYKVFDWYTDVWIATETSIVSIKWKVFTSNLLYIPYSKIEWIEVRTRSWLSALLKISDVVVKMSWQDYFILESSAKSGEIVAYLQSVTQHNGSKHADNDREPFEILVETLSDVVKWQLIVGGKNYITRDYIEKLDETLTKGVPIDLRTQDEKIVIDTWKNTYSKKSNEHENSEWEHKDAHH
jgi:hypothetical protein